MKKYILLFVVAALMALSCEPLSIEENVENPVVNNIYTTIPYSLNSVSTGINTKVSYDGAYSIADGDKLSIVGKDREITGILEYNETAEEWQGNLTYITSEGSPVVGRTELVATLIHAANDVETSYANAVVGSDQSDMLKYAVEHYSMLKADYTFGDDNITVYQQASFLDVTVTFTFPAGTARMQEGTTYVDIETPAGTVSGSTVLVADGDNFKAQFMAVVPAGHDVKDFKIALCDREITFTNSTTLLANKKYTVTRTIEYKPVLGDPFWSDGSFGRYPHDSGVDIIGVIVYVNDTESDLDNALTEAANGGGHALVMALHNAGEGVKWGPTNHTYSTVLESPQDIRSGSNLSGYSNTNVQYQNCTAASLAKGYEGGTNYDNHTTGWFLPSIGQWFYSIITYGEADPIEDWTDNGDANGHNIKNYLQYGNWQSLIRVKEQSTKDDYGFIVNKFNERLALLASEYNITYDSFGMISSNGTADNYWTSSEASDSEAIRMNFGSVEGTGPYYATIKTKPEKKNATYSWKSEFIMKVRPFLAF